MTFWYIFMLLFGVAFGYLICWFFFPRKVEVEKEVVKTITKQVPIEKVVEKEVKVEVYPSDYNEYLAWKKKEEEKAKAKAEKAAKKKSQVQ